MRNARPLRILHVAEAFGGGLFETVRLMANGAARAGHEVTIASGRRPETPERPAALLDADVAIEELAWGRRTLRAQLQAWRTLRTILAATQPHVLHLHSSFAGVMGALLPRRSGTIAIYTPHSFASSLPSSTASARLMFAVGERLTVWRCDALGVVSRSEARIARRRFPRADVHTILNGIVELDADALSGRRADRSSERARPLVVAAGRIVPQRQPERCARILAGVADLADTAWIGGGGEDTGWAAAARECLEQAGVQLTGWLPRDRALMRLGEATAYLHWTAWDGQALSILEAMACDTIVVASDIEPNREILGPGPVCISEARAIELLRRILIEPNHARGLLADQHERRSGHAASRMVADWLDLYARLCSR